MIKAKEIPIIKITKKNWIDEFNKFVDIDYNISERKKFHYQLITIVFFLREDAFLPNWELRGSKKYE